MRHLLNKLILPLGLKIIKSYQAELVYLHHYAGGYEEYRATQTRHNRRKLHNVWADGTTLSAIVDDLRAHGLGETGICHGARNGFEVRWLRERLGGDVIGTDISETAAQFSQMLVWDFHEPNPEWEARFDFVYTNSLDQAMEPSRALDSWVKQIGPRGRIYVEHTIQHSASHAGEMDPFGAHPMVMPYLFFLWGRGKYQMVDILEIEAKQNNDLQAWVFVLTKVDVRSNA